MQCKPTIKFVSDIVKGLLLLTKSDHVLDQEHSPYEELFFCFSLHIALMHEYHGHQICTFKIPAS